MGHKDTELDEAIVVIYHRLGVLQSTMTIIPLALTLATDAGEHEEPWSGDILCKDEQKRLTVHSRSS
jgi:hypothetical protein